MSASAAQKPERCRQIFLASRRKVPSGGSGRYKSSKKTCGFQIKSPCVFFARSAKEAWPWSLFASWARVRGGCRETNGGRGS